MSYNNQILDDLRFIESNGLQTTNGMVLVSIICFTSTGRPSNRFGGINFFALNKKDGSREKSLSVGSRMVYWWRWTLMHII